MFIVYLALTLMIDDELCVWIPLKDHKQAMWMAISSSFQYTVPYFNIQWWKVSQYSLSASETSWYCIDINTHGDADASIDTEVYEDHLEQKLSVTNGFVHFVWVHIISTYGMRYYGVVLSILWPGLWNIMPGQVRIGLLHGQRIRWVHWTMCLPSAQQSLYNEIPTLDTWM